MTETNEPKPAKRITLTDADGDPAWLALMYEAGGHRNAHPSDLAVAGYVPRAELEAERIQVEALRGALTELTTHVASVKTAVYKLCRPDEPDIQSVPLAKLVEMAELECNAEHERVIVAETHATELQKQLDAAWEATGVASTVRGLTTLDDVIRVNREQLTDAEARCENLAMAAGADDIGHLREAAEILRRRMRLPYPGQDISVWFQRDQELTKAPSPAAPTTKDSDPETSLEFQLAEQTSIEARRLRTERDALLATVHRVIHRLDSWGGRVPYPLREGWRETLSALRQHLPKDSDPTVQPREEASASSASTTAVTGREASPLGQEKQGQPMAALRAADINLGVCCVLCDTRPPFKRTMVVCTTCGNKRCPKATDHRLDCSGSNEPGQPGSCYAVTSAQDASPPGAPTREDGGAELCCGHHEISETGGSCQDCGVTVPRPMAADSNGGGAGQPCTDKPPAVGGIARNGKRCQCESCWPNWPNPSPHAPGESVTYGALLSALDAAIKATGGAAQAGFVAMREALK